MAWIAIIISILSLFCSFWVLVLEYYKGGQETKQWVQQLRWRVSYIFKNKKYKIMVDKTWNANKHKPDRYRYDPTFSI